MHTREINGTTFIYNSDYSGEVTINDSGCGRAIVDYKDLREFVLEELKQSLIEKLENVDLNSPRNIAFALAIGYLESK